MKVLIVDDDKRQAKLLSESLHRIGYNAKWASETGKALYLYQKGYTIVIMDLKMPEKSGIELMEEMKALDEGIFIFLTAHGTIPTAVEAIKKGALDYLTKPVDLDQMEIVIKRAIEIQKLKDENKRLKEELAKIESAEGFVIGNNIKVNEIFALSKQVAQTDATVLILGESGTGKEILAKFIHRESKRKGRFVAVHTGAIPETLLEAELFGYEKGAFTGANKRKEGKIEWAEGGTLFLDEIGDMPPSLQGKLLRFLQDRAFERVGGLETITVNCRVIAATNQDLMEKMRNGNFRDDLYYRLNVVNFEMPPLRERREDIPLLVAHFLELYSKKYNKPVKSVTKECQEILIEYSFPGNIRELQNLIERAVILARDETITSIPGLLADKEEKEDFVYSLKEMEKRHIDRILKITRGNISKAAELLGVHRNTLREKIKKWFR